MVAVIISIFLVLVIFLHGTGTGTEAPSATVHMPSAWAPTDHVLMRWDDRYDPYYTTLTREITAVAKVEIIVEDADTETHVRSVLQEHDIEMVNVTVRVRDTDTIWIRDYGPQTVIDRETGERVFVNARYADSRSNDDGFSAWYASVTGTELLEPRVNGEPIHQDGGNIILDGMGAMYMTNQLHTANTVDDTTSAERLEESVRDVYGVDTVHIAADALSVGPNHIDMQATFVNATTVLVSETVPVDRDHETLEETASYFAEQETQNGSLYQVHRVPLVKDIVDGETVLYSYTNSLIVNGKVLVPTYDLPTDENALQVYRDVLPEYEVVGIDARRIAENGGSIHCTTLQVPAAPASPG